MQKIFPVFTELKITITRINFRARKICCYVRPDYYSSYISIIINKLVYYFPVSSVYIKKWNIGAINYIIYFLCKVFIIYKIAISFTVFVFQADFQYFA